MRIYINKENLIQSLEEAPDKLRALIGRYYTINNNGQIVSKRFDDFKIDGFSFSPRVIVDQVMFPYTTERIHFYGQESHFRDHIQWNTYVNSVVKENVPYEDFSHTVGGQSEHNRELKHVYHHPDYEDLSKEYDTNMLVNYYINSYSENDSVNLPTLRNISALRNQFDPAGSQYSVKTKPEVKRLINTYEGRINNYVSDLNEIIEKQRNIFVLDDSHKQAANILCGPNGAYPYYLEFEVDNYTDHPFDFQNIVLREYKMEKFILQYVNNNVAFQNSSYILDGKEVVIKEHSFSELLINNDLSTFSEAANELFILDKDDTLYQASSNRFVNRINTVRFLQKYRAWVKPHSTGTDRTKSIEQIFASKPDHDYQFVCWKVEKFIDRESTVPIQTSYYNAASWKNRLFDTQLKYGREYVHKVSLVTAVLGHRYEYTNLAISRDGGDLVRSDGTIVNQSFAGDTNKKYKAFVDVQVYPTLKILEIPVKTHHSMFYDQPTLPPETFFYNESGQHKFKAILRPNLNNVLVSPELKFIPITDYERTVVTRNLRLSHENVYGYLSYAPGFDPAQMAGGIFSTDYFTGIYEIFRMETPPKKLSDFSKYFLTRVDMDAKITHQGRNGLQQNDPINNTANIRESVQNNMVAHFEDDIVPNKKYYYLFRTLTYHGTPGNPSPIFEVELIFDSDESKVNLKEYKIVEDKNYNYKKSGKRLIKILPNYEHLIFTGNETSVSDALGSLGILEKKLFRKSFNKKFKIRITSKHTGKMVDINLTFKVNDNTN